MLAEATAEPADAEVSPPSGGSGSQGPSVEQLRELKRMCDRALPELSQSVEDKIQAATQVVKTEAPLQKKFNYADKLLQEAQAKASAAKSR
eukprot:11055788-Alexandrium_andersonii.AAC.1